MTLAAALAAARRQDLGGARDALIAVWRERRSPALAELIALLDARAPDARSAQIAGIVTRRAATTLANLRALDDVDDPRLAGFAIDALARPPFTSAGADALLLALVATAARHRDPRLTARADAIRAALTTRIGRLAARAPLLAALRHALPPPAAAPSAADAELERSLAALVDPLRATGRTAETLLAAIYADPADDAARRVYADLLSQRGDPRGELIALQLADVDPARQAELLAEHGKAWLGDLAPVLSWGKGYAKTTFRRGFVSTADIILSVGKKLQPIVTHPAWATVETIVGYGRDRDRLFERAPLRGLRELRVNADTVALLGARADKLTALTRVELGHPLPTPDALRAAVPNVVTLIQHWAHPDLGELAACVAYGTPHVELFGAVAVPRADMERFVRQLVGTPAPLARLTLHTGWQHTVDRPPPFELVRGPDGAYRLGLH